MNKNDLTEKMLNELRESLGEKMSDKRRNHTLEVEKMAERLGRIYLTERIPELRAAALLHDITKELSTEEHIEILEKHGVEITKSDRLSPKTFHARTAALLIPEQYPSLSSPDIISAVRYHTTGRADMTIMQKLIYLADYIDMSRTFEDCVHLREYFFDFDFDSATEREKMNHLNDTLILSYDMTIKGLVDGGKIINENTFEARNYLVLNKKEQ